MDIAAVKGWAEQNFLWLQLIGFVINLGLFIFFIIINRRLRKYRYLIKGDEGKNLEEVLLDLSQKASLNQDKLQQLEKRLVNNENLEAKHFQNWGLVRFKAFQNTGSDQSFSFAILDAAGDGIVLSSLFGREESRSYCKLVENGTSAYPLSEEEKEAIARALGKKGLKN